MTSSAPSLKRPSYPLWYRRLLSALRQFYSEGKLTDAELRCGDGGCLRAHGALLAAGSGVIRRITVSSVDEEDLVVELPDFSAEAVRRFVEGVFYGVKNGAEQDREFGELCRLFDVHGSGSSAGESAANVRRQGAAKPLEWVVGGDGDSDWEGDGRNSDEDDDLKILQTEDGELLLLDCAAEDEEEEVGVGDQEETKNLGLVINPRRPEEERMAGRRRLCALCGERALEHRVRLEGDARGEDSSSSSFVYRCCGKKCAEDCVLLKNARSFHAHVGTRREIHFHAEEKENDDRGPGGGHPPKANPAPCPLCGLDQSSHRSGGGKRGRLYRCCRCTASKLTSDRFKRHVRAHAAPGSRCRICGREYRFPAQLRRHFKAEHGEVAEEEEEEEGEWLKCDVAGCDYVARLPGTLASHKSDKHRSDGLAQARSHHGKLSSDKDNGDSNVVECPTCGKALKRWYFQQVHQKVCSSGAPVHRCNICMQGGFVSRTTLQNHIRSRHTGERPHECPHCPARYATAMSLTGHLARKHNTNRSGEFVPHKSFMCPNCGKMLSTRTKLAQHVRTVHEGARDYPCPQCGRRFSSGSNLKTHINTQHGGRRTDDSARGIPNDEDDEDAAMVSAALSLVTEENMEEGDKEEREQGNEEEEDRDEERDLLGVL